MQAGQSLTLKTGLASALRSAATDGRSGEEEGDALGLESPAWLPPPEEGLLAVGLVGSSLLPLVRRFLLRGSRFTLAAFRASMKKSLSWRPAAKDTERTS